MNDPEQPDIVPARSAWLVWIVPAIALLVGGYLLYEELASRGPLITVSFVNGSGVEAGSTQVVSRGVVVGQVEGVRLADDRSRVDVEARLVQSAEDMARAGSRIWIVRPQISATGISGLDTLLGGPYLEIDPGKGEEQRTFTGLEHPPFSAPATQRYTLHVAQRGSIKPGVPVLFRGVEVGKVVAVDIADDATEVLVEIEIAARYGPLVRDGTVFWDAGGVKMDVGILGASLRAGSLESVLGGAVAFALPPDSVDAPVAPSGSHFELHPEPDDDWLEWDTAISLSPAAGESPSDAETAP